MRHEPELDDIQVREGLEFRWDGDDGKGGRRESDEMWFMLRGGGG